MKLVKKAKKGFTIVELVIVIGVIGILSAILIPTFVNVTKNAEAAQLRSNLQSSYSMYIADAAENDDIKMISQSEAFLSEAATVDAVATSGYYTYDYVNGGWKVDAVKATVANLASVNGTTPEKYGAYYVYYVAA